MGKLKKLFLEMQQAMIEGRQIEKEMQDRMRDDEYRYSIYKTCDKCSYDNLDDDGDVLEHYCKDDELYTPKTKDNGEDK